MRCLCAKATWQSRTIITTESVQPKPLRSIANSPKPLKLLRKRRQRQLLRQLQRRPLLKAEWIAPSAALRAGADSRDRIQQRLSILGAVVANSFDGTTFHCFFAERFLFRGFGLLINVGVAAVIVTFKIGGRSLAAQIAVDTLLINIVFARNVLGIFVRNVRHSFSVKGGGMLGRNSPSANRNLLFPEIVPVLVHHAASVNCLDFRIAGFAVCQLAFRSSSSCLGIRSDEELFYWRWNLLNPLDRSWMQKKFRAAAISATGQCRCRDRDRGDRMGRIHRAIGSC